MGRQPVFLSGKDTCWCQKVNEASLPRGFRAFETWPRPHQNWNKNFSKLQQTIKIRNRNYHCDAKRLVNTTSTEAALEGEGWSVEKSLVGTLVPWLGIMVSLVVASSHD